ncbi:MULTISPECIES: HAMP domain-containing sensor histidine kinase [unclassified Duganella]|uniref:sensor histidine kinase n=1 Tax=unclassified Duganella TaxID=2636909 RepID=UPI00088103B5|nr:MULTISPECIES: HAMP domain-containing sensor histidine kinase [unclassified Duganella]SDF50402.1 Signal transduction histidine kinase [Duganella sp. OV458]SDI76619.1 Signal transduction histidine kinase [Duganella sp. OV510]
MKRFSMGLPRLYFRFYVALLFILALFAIATTLIWNRSGSPLERSNITLSKLVSNMLAPADAPPEEQQAALARMAYGMNAHMTLYTRDWRPLAVVGEMIPARHWRKQGVTGPPPESFVRLPDGRKLLSSEPLGFTRPKAMLHNALMLVALGIGIAAFPLVRHLTKRLERLQQGVESLGAGDLTTRVKVEGKDEVARLAQSFNRAADQIEQLVGAHKTLLANASHELRTPLARIRLALELITEGIDPKRRAGLEQDIAELNHLLDEILLASRLGAIRENTDTEELDLLALTAEECARYDEATLDGESAIMHGDPRLLRRLLRNLLENAHRHGVPPANVQITCADGVATLRVWDKGPGVPDSEFERVFEPFFRRRGTLDNTGAGLGLALVRQIARRHGGEARCVLMRDGRSCFEVTLPLA